MPRFSEETRTRRPRADAGRNRARILDAARALFAERGSDAQMDDIAARAGVAVGTLYNHFATKQGLLEAAITDRIAEAGALVDAAARRIDDGAEPWDEFAALLRAFAAAHTEDRAFKAAAAALGVASPHEDAGGEFLERVDALLARVRGPGGLRPDVDAADLALVLGGLPGTEVAPAQRERYLSIILRGLSEPR